MTAFIPMQSQTDTRYKILEEILNGGFYVSVGSCAHKPTQYLLHLYILTLLGFSL